MIDLIKRSCVCFNAKTTWIHLWLGIDPNATDVSLCCDAMRCGGFNLYAKYLKHLCVGWLLHQFAWLRFSSVHFSLVWLGSSWHLKWFYHRTSKRNRKSLLQFCGYCVYVSSLLSALFQPQHRHQHQHYHYCVSFCSIRNSKVLGWLV